MRSSDSANRPAITASLTSAAREGKAMMARRQREPERNLPQAPAFATPQMGEHVHHRPCLANRPRGRRIRIVTVTA